MRGFPIIQAVVLIFVLAALGYAGMRFIGTSPTASHTLEPPVEKATPAGSQSIELEIYFSAKPVKYTLHRPEGDWKEGGHILTVRDSDENPALHTYQTRGAEDETLWMDVTWPEESIGKRHFVQVIATVGMADPQKFTFHDTSMILRGTMQLNLGTNP